MATYSFAAILSFKSIDTLTFEMFQFWVSIIVFVLYIVNGIARILVITFKDKQKYRIVLFI